MTNTEFSNEFDILYNNIMSNQAPGLDGYEKSIFLTQAQEALILDYYGGNNITGDSFEKTEEIRRALSNLVKTRDISIGGSIPLSSIGISDYPQFVDRNFLDINKVWVIVREAVDFKDSKEVPLGCHKGKNIEVVPITLDDFSRIKDNPFRKDTINRVLRIDSNSENIELVSKYKIDKYRVSYIEKPSPIILENLSQYNDSLKIDNESGPLECKLNSITHRAILNRAVILAKNVWNSK